LDESRAGLNLGEGAAYIILERDDNDYPKKYAYLSGYANICEAYHQTASSPEGDGPFQAMKAALENANLRPEDIDYINFHGTGTPNNDLSEGNAVKRLFGEKLPPLSSTKSYTGHTLGAAGAIEAVFSVLSIEKGIIYPNLNFQTPIKEHGLIPVTEFQTGLNIRHVLSDSFGFGGNDSALIFSKTID
jgi:3-oxoacyl-[acyl-carrier-protein] synthase-1